MSHNNNEDKWSCTSKTSGGRLKNKYAHIGPRVQSGKSKKISPKKPYVKESKNDHPSTTDIESPKSNMSKLSKGSKPFGSQVLRSQNQSVADLVKEMQQNAKNNLSESKTQQKKKRAVKQKSYITTADVQRRNTILSEQKQHDSVMNLSFKNKTPGLHWVSQDEFNLNQSYQ